MDLLWISPLSHSVPPSHIHFKRRIQILSESVSRAKKEHFFLYLPPHIQKSDCAEYKSAYWINIWIGSSFFWSPFLPPPPINIIFIRANHLLYTFGWNINKGSTLFFYRESFKCCECSQFDYNDIDERHDRKPMILTRVQIIMEYAIHGVIIFFGSIFHCTKSETVGGMQTNSFDLRWYLDIDL